MPFGLLKYGISNDYPFEKEADLPLPTELKRQYDVVIIGGGGHGVATAYYLAKYHGITNVAVLEKGYLGGGNTARNTAVIRSNYLTPEGVKFYSVSVKLYENLSNEFDFNIMLFISIFESKMNRILAFVCHCISKSTHCLVFQILRLKLLILIFLHQYLQPYH